MEELMQWLNSNGYESIHEWMLDSDFGYDVLSDTYFSIDDPSIVVADPVGTVWAAYESSGEMVA